MGAALARHDELLRATVTAHGGTVFATGGDGLAAVFGRAAEGAAAAVTAQQALGEVWAVPVELRVRMALHTGEAEERDGDYFGPAVNRAARLMAEARGGEVLVSTATAEVVRWQLREGLSLVDLGEVDLRGLGHPERVWELCWPGSSAREVTKPPVGFPLGNLPRARRLVGRGREEAAVRDLLSREPLVTLTGPGGVGKTSLALSVSAALAPGFADGVWFCELAAVLERQAVAQAVGETLGLRPQSGLTPFELLVRALGHQACLLVLDNCEHVVDATAELAEAVVARCPDVRVLATSREALGAPGEHVVAVATLDLEAAVTLFLERASDHQGGFGVDDDGLVAELCAALDGLPLALELAAARSRSMPLADLVHRLGARFRLLHGPRRAAGRHQTLRETVAWSYDLLAPDEQRLFDRLSVFAGGFDLAAAEAVCADDDLDAVDVDRLVAALVDKSMVVPAPGGRYALLETLRQFGEERLADTGGAELMRRNHLRWYTTFVVAAHDGLQGPAEGAWWRRLQADWANVRPAFSRAMALSDIEAATSITTHLMWPALWHDTAEPCVWLDALVAVDGVSSSAGWPDVLAALAMATWLRGDLEQAVEIGQRALAIEPPDRPNIDYLADLALLSAAYFDGRRELSELHIERLGERARASHRPVIEAINLVNRVIFLMGDRDYSTACRVGERALELAESTGNPTAIGWALGYVAGAGAGLGDPAAEAVALRALDVGRDGGTVMPSLAARRVLASLAMVAGNRHASARHTLDILQSMRRRSSWVYAAQSLPIAGLVLASGPTADIAAKLCGAAERSSVAAGEQTAVRRAVDSLRRRLSDALDEARLADLVSAGNALQVEQAVLLAEAALAELIASEEAAAPQG